jgi:hypothetical protein
MRERGIRGHEFIWVQLVDRSFIVCPVSHVRLAWVNATKTSRTPTAPGVTRKVRKKHSVSHSGPRRKQEQREIGAVHQGPSFVNTTKVPGKAPRSLYCARALLQASCRCKWCGSTHVDTQKPTHREISHGLGKWTPPWQRDLPGLPKVKTMQFPMPDPFVHSLRC